MTTTTLPTITHRIQYDRLTKDFACYVQIDGDPEQYIGSADSYHAGELKCVEYKRDLIDLDSRPIPRCDDCKSPLGDLGFCEECAGRAESLTTAFSANGWESQRTHSSIEARNEYLALNPQARIVATEPPTAAPYDNEELAHWWAKDQEVFALKLMALTEPQLVLQAVAFTAHINDRAYKSINRPGIQAETTLRVWRSIIAKASPPIEPPPALAMRVAA